jgi:hypothetical protein
LTFDLSIGAVACSSCGFASELLSSDRRRSLWTQLSGFLACNGCPECDGGELRLTRTGFVDLRTPVRGLH